LLNSSNAPDERLYKDISSLKKEVLENPKSGFLLLKTAKIFFGVGNKEKYKSQSKYQDFVS
jgi:hypothetical protein